MEIIGSIRRLLGRVRPPRVRTGPTLSSGGRDDLSRAVSGLVYLRTKLRGDVELGEAERTQVWAYLIAAVADGEDEVAARLIERIDDLDISIDAAMAGLSRVAEQARATRARMERMPGEQPDDGLAAGLRILDSMPDEVAQFMARATEAPAHGRVEPDSRTPVSRQLRLDALRKRLKDQGGGDDSGGAPAFKG